MRPRLQPLIPLLLLIVLGGCAAGSSVSYGIPEVERPEAATAPPRAVDAITDPVVEPATDPAAERAIERPEAAGTILRSPNDDREFRHLVLDNRLQVLLVSDPDTDKAAASLTVFRGSHHDPDEFPGLAHFLEHMLFIGTAKYPAVDQYQQFVAQHGGSSNAYTAGNHTNYFFDIQPEYFSAAMDRFAQFFISPLFAEEYVEREKNAVHSEFQLQLKADNWRANAAVAEAMNPDHPDARFSIGNLETLGSGVQEALPEFFTTRYSADQMVLVAVSNEPLDVMETWITPMFGAIEDRDLGPVTQTEPLFRAEDLPAVLNYRTIKDGYQIVYNFPVPFTEQYYRQKPASYISNLLGHEGEGSLYEKLLRLGWIEALSAGTGTFDDANSLLVVSIDLTEAGYENRDQVTDLLFRYIDLIRGTPPEEWRYQEQARVAELGFRFQEQSSAMGFVYQVAPRFIHYPASDVLAASFLMTDFDAELIGEYLAHLRPDNVLVEVAGPDVETDSEERWFGVPFRLQRGPVPREAVQEPAVAEGLALPEPNPYLPDNLDVLPSDAEPPQLAVARPGLTLWSDRDTSFNTPRASLHLSLAIPGGIASARDLAHAHLYRRLVEDALSVTLYPAYLAGMSYSIGVSGEGFELSIRGYSDKQLTLLDAILDTFVDLEIDPERFRTLKQELLREWRNYRDERPYTQAYQALNYLLLSSQWPPELLRESLLDTDVAALDAWRTERASRFHVLGLHHGNVAESAAWALAATLQQRLRLSAFRREPARVGSVAEAIRYGLDIDHQDAAMVLYVQDPDASIASRARSALASTLLRQAYFSSLRTDQQLGYVVTITNQTLRDRSGLAFIVQSPVASVPALERATAEFLVQQQEVMAEMPEDEFARYQAGLINRLTERDRNLAERGQRLWHDLDLGILTFDLRERIAAAVGELTREDMQAFIGELATRLTDQRLLVFSVGGFDETPDHGRELPSVQAFKAD